nr:AC087852_2 putative reverse transcriptase [Ipomoea batatas]
MIHSCSITRPYVHHSTNKSPNLNSSHPEDYTKDSPTFSLNAISGVTKRNMMKVRVKIASTFIVALLDSRSSDNFINFETTRDLGLQMTPLKDLRVRVTNGDCLSALGVCEAVPFTKESNSFSATLFVLPLVGFQMVLGVKWLKELGPITWDFNSLHMTFYHHNTAITWPGEEWCLFLALHAIPLPSSNIEVLEGLLAIFSDIFLKIQRCHHHGSVIIA